MKLKGWNLLLLQEGNYFSCEKDKFFLSCEEGTAITPKLNKRGEGKETPVFGCGRSTLKGARETNLERKEKAPNKDWVARRRGRVVGRLYS